MSSQAWRRFGADGIWTTELEESDRLALVGLEHGSAASVAVAEGLKSCGRCGERKPLEAFGKRARSADGRQPWCKACARREAAERRGSSPLVAELIALDETNSRICRSCYRQRPREEFRPDPTRASGLARECGSCFAKVLELAA